tara:strand:- start:2550 stop:3281 length:732 start_codon:yes stop_codon:yes gene_type:complete
MTNITYVSLSQATALARNMDSTAHNLANASTSGYKAIHPLIESVPDGSGDSSVSYVRDKGTYLELESGPLTPTGNPLDIAISGEGWLTYQLPGGETGYSRHGRLVVDVDGQLKTSGGMPLLGAGGGPVQLPDDVGDNVVISTGGTLTNQAGAVLGSIAVVTIDDAAAMLPIGGGMYQLPADAGVPQQSVAPIIKQGFVEGSNVKAVLEMTRLIDIQRAYDNAVKLMGSDDDLTRTAIQKLGRV